MQPTQGRMQPNKHKSKVEQHNWEYPRPSILCQTRYWTIMMPIIEAGSAVPGQNDGKKTVYIILYPEGTSRSTDESGLFYLITY